jgi:hypothetical protein
MTVSFVGSASAEATSLTLPSHQAGDLLIIFAMRNGAGGAITPPTGWLMAGVATFGAATATHQTCFKTAASAAETSGTWTGASLLACAVYRHTTNTLFLTGPSGFRNSVVSTSIAWSQKAGWLTSTIPGNVSDRMFTASSWVAAIGCTTSGTVTMGGTPSGLTSRFSATGASANGYYFYDTNAAVASFASTTTTAASSIAAVTQTLEIVDSGFAKTSAGMLVHPGMSGGMRG